MHAQLHQLFLLLLVLEAPAVSWGGATRLRRRLSSERLFDCLFLLWKFALLIIAIWLDEFQLWRNFHILKLFHTTQCPSVEGGHLTSSDAQKIFAYTLFQNGRWFMRIQIGPCCLVQDKIYFWILSVRKRHQGLIWIKTKEYLNGGHFGKRCMELFNVDSTQCLSGACNFFRRLC